MLHIKVPATSANMGPGFDSIGVALQLYNHLWVEEIPNGLAIEIKREQGIAISRDENNLIYQTMAAFYAELGKQMPAVRLIQEDFIPMVRGLGSSAACIVAGLLAANALSGANYSVEHLAQIAAKMEGHPDNSNPALMGGMVVGVLNQEKMGYVKVDMPEDLIFAAMVPDFPVSTTKSRGVLPQQISREDAIFNASRAGLLVASMYTRKYENLAMAMEDKMHQPYRKQLIPDMDGIFQTAKESGALATYLSGAGSTLMAVLKEDIADEFETKMTRYLSSIPNGWKLTLLKPDKTGAQIIAE